MHQKDKENITKELLVYLLISGGISLVLTNPAFIAPAILVAKYLDKGTDKKKLENSVQYLKKQKYISISSTGRKSTIRLTGKGRKLAGVHAIQGKLKKLRDEEHNRWDGVWYIVIFDIENDKRAKRDALRHMLQKSGFEQLQKSVWVYPFDCREEVAFVKNFFGIKEEECRVIVFNNIERDKSLRKKFKLSAT